jgi:hypothetical protein
MIDVVPQPIELANSKKLMEKYLDVLIKSYPILSIEGVFENPRIAEIMEALERRVCFDIVDNQDINLSILQLVSEKMKGRDNEILILTFKLLISAIDELEKFREILSFLIEIKNSKTFLKKIILNYDILDQNKVFENPRIKESIHTLQIFFNLDVVDVNFEKDVKEQNLLILRLSYLEFLKENENIVFKSAIQSLMSAFKSLTVNKTRKKREWNFGLDLTPKNTSLNTVEV